MSDAAAVGLGSGFRQEEAWVWEMGVQRMGHGKAEKGACSRHFDRLCYVSFFNYSGNVACQNVHRSREREIGFVGSVPPPSVCVKI